MRGRPTRIVAPFLGLVALGVSWEVAALLVPHSLLAGPVATARAFGPMVASGGFLSALALSLKDLYLGLGIGALGGLIVGTLVGGTSFMRGLAGPYVTVLNPIPNVILLPVFILWFGLGLESRVIYIALFAFWPVLLNMSAGVSRSLSTYDDLCRVYGMTPWQTIRKTMIPSAVPYVIAGFRIAVAAAAVGMIIAELEVDYTGLGRLLILDSGNLQMAQLEGVVVATAIIGLVNVGVLKAVAKLGFPWIDHLSGAGG